MVVVVVFYIENEQKRVDHVRTYANYAKIAENKIKHIRQIHTAHVRQHAQKYFQSQRFRIIAEKHLIKENYELSSAKKSNFLSLKPTKQKLYNKEYNPVNTIWLIEPAFWH